MADQWAPILIRAKKHRNTEVPEQLHIYAGQIKYHMLQFGTKARLLPSKEYFKMSKKNQISTKFDYFPKFHYL